MNIPILLEHDCQKVVGRMYVDSSNRLKVVFNEAIPKELFFELFPGIGARIMKSSFTAAMTNEKIKEAEIYEFSFTPDMKSFIPSRALGVRGDC